MTSEPELTARQQQAIAAILEHDTREESAKAARVSVRTLQRWLRTAAFTTELARQRTRLLDATATELIRGSAGAARALISIAKGDSRASAPRVAAARAVVDLACRFDERGELVQRLEALEQAVGDKEKKDPRGGSGPWQ